MIKTLFKKAWSGYCNNFKLVLLILLVCYIPFDLIHAYIDMHVFGPEDLRASFRLTKLINQFILIVPDAAFIFIAYRYFMRERSTFTESMSVGFSHYGKMWLTRFLTYLSYLTLILLVFPGIYLLTRWLFSEIAVVREGYCGTSAFARSWELTRGRFWQVFGISLLGFSPLLLVVLLISTAYIFVPVEHWLIDAFIAMLISIIIPFHFFFLTAFYDELCFIEDGVTQGVSSEY